MTIDAARYRLDFDEASQEIHQLYFLRYVWKNIHGMITSNPNLSQSGLVHGYLNVTYTRTLAIGVRRQCDDSGSRATVGSLLRRVAAHSPELTRSTLGFEPIEDLTGTEDYWPRFALDGTDVLDPAPALALAAKMTSESQVARRWANKRVAHLDRQPAGLTFGELDQALAVLGEATRWLHGLFNSGGHLLYLTPVADRSWTAMFTDPWLDGTRWNEITSQALG